MHHFAPECSPHTSWCGENNFVCQMNQLGGSLGIYPGHLETPYSLLWVMGSLMTTVNQELEHLIQKTLSLTALCSPHCIGAMGVIWPEGKSPPTCSPTQLPEAAYFSQEVSHSSTNQAHTHLASAIQEAEGAWMDDSQPRLYCLAKAYSPEKVKYNFLTSSAEMCNVLICLFFVYHYVYYYHYRIQYLLASVFCHVLALVFLSYVFEFILDLCPNTPRVCVAPFGYFQVSRSFSKSSFSLVFWETVFPLLPHLRNHYLSCVM